MDEESQPGPRLRSCIFATTYESSRELVEADCRRFDQLAEGAQWRIEWNAESCPVVHATPEIRMSRVAIDGRIIRLFFRIVNDAQCEALYVDAVDDPAWVAE